MELFAGRWDWPQRSLGVTGVDVGQVQAVLNQVVDQPARMIRRQPAPQVRRQQQLVVLVIAAAGFAAAGLLTAAGSTGSISTRTDCSTHPGLYPHTHIFPAAAAAARYERSAVCRAGRGVHPLVDGIDHHRIGQGGDVTERPVLRDVSE